MKSRQRARVWGASFVVSVMCAAPASAEWRRIDSPNFVVVGDVGERQLRDVAMQFEGFRGALSQILVAGSTGTAVPTVVIVFPHDRAYTPFKPLFEGKPVDVGGVFYAGRDVNYITLLGGGGPQSMRVLFHEYAHLVTSNVARNLPVWLSEGLAEFYSTYEPRGQRILIGMPIDSHIRLLTQTTPLPLDSLLAVNHESPLYNEGERRSVFYAQSWALTHLLLMGEPSRTELLKTFLQDIARGVSERDAWQKAFGGHQLDKDLQQYVRRFSMKAYQFDLPAKIAQFKGSAMPMPDADVQAILASLYRRQQRGDDARRLLAPILKARANDVHAGAVMAHLEIDKDNHAEAAKQLLSLGTLDDWFFRYLAAVGLADIAERDRRQGSDEIVAGAIVHFEAVTRQRELPNALARIAALELERGTDRLPQARNAIERARALAPGRDDYSFTHARVLGALGEFATARGVVAPMLHPGNPQHVRDGARSLMAYLVSLESYRKQRGGHADANGPAPPAHPGAQPPARTIPVYRETKPGEERVEGILERIECPPKTGPVFHIRMGERAVALKAAAFDKIDFITYRDDLSGSVNCGSLKSPLWVYVTLDAASPAGDKTVVAIEFLAK